jgi:hypothetical protein
MALSFMNTGQADSAGKFAKDSSYGFTSCRCFLSEIFKCFVLDFAKASPYF